MTLDPLHRERRCYMVRIPGWQNQNREHSKRFPSLDGTFTLLPIIVWLATARKRNCIWCTQMRKERKVPCSPFALTQAPPLRLFSDQLPPMIGFNDATESMGVEINPRLALDGVNTFSEFWTYPGSLTNPPWREGFGGFASINLVHQCRPDETDLGASTYSARAEQEV
ncbi:hypothetical protein GJ744_009030 [Endocarpon pusillum]|uniref:Uncharacterized protein n=1 Tax=Endocarpon pusillum TaxID=364733 RepID=A0A8H7AGE6_9EURO|nr:hypothetical protein GJ744_009030 [Endocarpon pusillum]